MFSISNNELNSLPNIVHKGSIIEYLHDGYWYEAIIEYGKDDKGEENGILGFYKNEHNGESYLASVSGKLLSRPNMRLKVDKPNDN